MDLTAPVKSNPVACPHCGADVPQTSGVGRVRLYCTPDAGKLYRRRMRALFGTC